MRSRRFPGLLALLVAGLGTLVAPANGQSSYLQTVSLQYWQDGDYPDYPYGHDEQGAWVDGHYEDVWGIDENGEPGVVDTHWVDGYYESEWILDGYSADGQWGSKWSTTAGNFDRNTVAGLGSTTSLNIDRGFLTNPYAYGSTVYFQPWAKNVPWELRVIHPNGSLVIMTTGWQPATASFSSPGPYSFTTWDDGNYTILITTQQPGGNATTTYKVAVGTMQQTISFAPISSHSLGDPAFAPVATASSGLPVSFAVVSGPATISNGAVTVTGNGTVVLRASQPGGSNNGFEWGAAPTVDRSFTVSGTAQTITFAPIADHTLGQGTFTVSATASSGLPVSFGVTAGPATVSGNTVTLTGSGTVTITASQAGNGTYGPAPLVGRNFNALPDSDAPSLPTALVASNVGTGSFVLSWSPATDGVGVTAYEVWRNGVSLGTVPGTSMTVSGVSPSTTYSMEVRARDAVGNWSGRSSPSLSVTTLAFLPPRLALQYWEAGDYPDYPLDEYNNSVWLDGYLAEDWGYDENGEPVLLGTHWVDGHYEYEYSGTIILPDGLNGSRWSTTTGIFNINSSASGYSAASASRGALDTPYPFGCSIALRFWGQAPGNNCNTYSGRVYTPLGTLVASGTFGSTTNWTPTVYLNQTGAWRVEIDYNNATGVTPASATVTYYVPVGSVQYISLDPIPVHGGQDAPFALVGSATSELPLSYSVVSGPATISGGMVTITGYGTVMVRATQGGGNANGYYWTAAETANTTITVSGLSQTIALPAIDDHVYGDPAFVLSASTSSGLPVSFAVTAGPATIAGNTVSLTGVGNVTISATQAGNGTYAPAPVTTRTFAVGKGNQTITFPPIAAHGYGDPTFFVPASTTSGLAVTRTLVSGPAVVSLGGMVTLTGLGTVTVKATQAGSANYYPAPEVTQSFAVSRIPGYYYLAVQNGSGSAVGGPPGTAIALTAYSPPNDQDFTGWSISSGEGTILSPTANLAVFTLGASDASVIANSAPRYSLTVENGTPGAATGVNGASISLVANADGNGLCFVGWRVMNGPGGFSQPILRNTCFIFGPGPAVVRAEFAPWHALSIVAMGFSNSPWLQSAGGTRGTDIEVRAPTVQAYPSDIFAGWLPQSPGAVLNSMLPSTKVIMGNSASTILVWAAPPAYVAACLRSAVSVSAQTLATGGTASIVGSGYGATTGGVSRLTIEFSTDYGTTWLMAPNGLWNGQATSSVSQTVTASYPTQTTLLVRVRAERPENTATYASLYDYARITFLAAGTLEIVNGTALASGGMSGTPVGITAGSFGQKQFTGWHLQAGNGVIVDPAAPSTSFIMGDSGAIVQANFSSTFTLTVKDGASATGLPGTPIPITAASQSFIGWTFDSSGVEVGAFQNRNSAQTIFTLGNGSAGIRANYANTAQNLRVTGGSPAAVQGVPGSTTTTLISAGVSQLGEHFDHWAFIGVPHGTISEPNNPTTHFTFGLGDAWIEPRYAAGGSLIVQSGTSDIAGGPSGQVINIVATPPAGNFFTSWSVIAGAGTFGDANQDHTTFTMGGGDVTIRANYTVGTPPPVVASGTCAATVGLSASYSITATNNPTSYGATGLPAGLTVNTSSGVISGTPIAAGTYTVTISATNAGGARTNSLILTVSPATASPTITSSLQDEVAAVGQSLSFSVAAVSTVPLSYQWRKNGTALTDGGNLSGAMSATLTLANLAGGDAGTYSVVVTNSAGSATSNTAVLTVTIPQEDTANQVQLNVHIPLIP